MLHMAHITAMTFPFASGSLPFTDHPGNKPMKKARASRSSPPCYAPTLRPPRSITRLWPSRASFAYIISQFHTIRPQFRA
jgi:hypothetical protein